MADFKKPLIGIVTAVVIITGGWFVLSKQTKQNGSSEPKVSGAVIAKVNSEEISSQEVASAQQVYSEQGQEISEQQALEQVINQKIISQAVEKGGYSVSTEEAEAEIETQLSAQGSSLEEFKKEVEEQESGSTYEQQLEYVKENMAVQNYFDDQINQEELEVTEEETEQFYEDYSQQQDTEEVAPYEELKPQIIASLEQQKRQQAINALIQQLRNEAEIEYL